MTTTTDSFDTVRGRVLRPRDDDYDAARAAWNLAIDQRPAAVVEAADADDVAAAVRGAAGAGLRVAAQATGHGAEALGPLDGAVLLKTGALREIAIDAGARTARVGAGVQAGEVAAAAAQHGLAPVLGLAPTVGVTGLTLAGGLGWLSRRHGLACNNVRAFDVVLADGDARRVTAESDAELFWALRGGGGRFAVVTAMELALHPLAEAYGGMIAWPAEDAADVLEHFRRWSDEAPETVSGVLRYLALPPIEAIPEPLRGRRVVAVIAVALGGVEDGRRALHPLCAAGTALLDAMRPLDPADLVRVAGDPEQPAPSRGAGVLTGPLTAELARELAAIVAEQDDRVLSALEVRQLGGALARPALDHGALASVDAAFAVFAAGPAPDQAAAAKVLERIAAIHERLAPWRVEQRLLSHAPAGTDPAEAFSPAVWERLCGIRTAVDPERRFVATHDR